MKKNFFIIAFMLVLVSCTKKQQLLETAETHEIELNACVDETPIYFCKNSLAEEFGDMELIALENNSENPMGEILKMQVSDSGIFILDSQQGGSIFHYASDGRFISRIGEKGHSRSEYSGILNFSVNTAGDTIAILDYNYVKLYNSDGNFLDDFSMKDTPQWQGFLLTDRGCFLSTNNRGQKTVLARYSNNFKSEDPLIKGQVNLIRDMPPSWQNQLQRDGENICYYDYYTSSLYVFNTGDLSKSKRYALVSPNALTESKAREAGLKSCEYDHLESFVFEDSTIWGIYKYGESLYDFKLDVQTDSCRLNHHMDKGYSFLCTHNGWYYYAFEPVQLLQLIGLDKYRMPAIGRLLKKVLKPYEETMKETDNYYILKVRRKKGEYKSNMTKVCQ